MILLMQKEYWTVEEVKETIIVKEWKKFRRYNDGAAYYGLSRNKFIMMAKDAGAIYKLDKVALVNCEIFEEYLETFKIL